MRNLIIILLTVLVVIAGAFLPEILLRSNSVPQIDMDYQQVSISSESSSDYAWRLERMAEHIFGEGEHLLATYISEVTPTEEGSEIHTQFLAELRRLAESGVVPEIVAETLEKSEDYRIRYYYLFDSEAVSGFRYAELSAASKRWNITMRMDVESGKIARVEYYGSDLLTRTDGSLTGWYDVLHGYADYLGLAAMPQEMLPAEDAEDSGSRAYYHSITADMLKARTRESGGSWLDLRVLRETGGVTIAVYNGGK